MTTRFMRRSNRMGIIAASVAIAISLFGLTGLTASALNRSGHGQKDPAPVSYEEDGTTSALATRALEGTIQQITYDQAYEGVTYEKEALVYVPASYTPGVPANIVYLTHGWWGTADGLAGGVAPIVDQLTSAGSITPTIVVFATYYPDRSFATEDYEDDYALNRFFATTEIDTLIKTVESHYTTFARGDTSDESLRASRRHRAFGGFSMGATTTWDVFALRPQYFYSYIPMAGESWIGREEDADSAQIAQLVTAGAERAHYGPQDFRIFASVGSLDPALDDMSPQLAQLRADYPDLMTDDSLQMWIDEGESHSMASVGNQVAHDLPLLFPPA
ncbi:alpha/beta hydrolase [Schaalia dentiphila]|nr:alpha/beta hydrolase-fold protein [Schaalia odontolytica]